MLAATVQSEMQARFITDAVSCWAAITRAARFLDHREGHRRWMIVTAQSSFQLRLTTCPGPSDISYFAHRRDLAAPKRIALLTGQMSPMAKRNFRKLGWTVYERVSP